MARIPRKIRVVVFDMDDTLFPERQYVRSGYRAVGEHLRLRTGRADLADWMWRRFRRGQSARMFDAANARFHLGLSAGQIRELVEIYRRHVPNIRPSRDVPGALAALRWRGIKLGLLSDGTLPSQRLKFQALGLEKYFDKVVFTAAFGPSAGKPSPRGYLLLQRHFRLPPSALAYVADNPVKDFIAPNALGWLTVRWRRAGQVYARHAVAAAGRPHRVVRTSAELLKLLLG